MKDLHSAPVVDDFLMGHPLRLMNFVASLEKDGLNVGITSGIIPGPFKDPEKFQHTLCPAVSAATDILESWVMKNNWLNFIESDKIELALFDLEVNFSMKEDGGLILLASYTPLSNRGCDYVLSPEGERARLMIQEMVGTALEKTGIR